MTDQTQGNWNGITGRIELRTAYQPTIRIFPNAAQHKAVIVIDGEKYEVSLGDTVRRWSEFSPYLYTRTVTHHGYPYTVTFGIREIAVDSRQILLMEQQA